MKNKILLTAIFTLALITLTANADPWAHRYDGTGGQSWRATTNQGGLALTVAVEWNQASWTSSDFGWGTSTDGSGWTWQDCPWFENGNNDDKRCRTDVTISGNGTYYYAFRLVYSAGTYYQYGDATWADINANTTLSADTASFIKIVPEPASMFLVLLGLGLLKFRK